jgi:hypothetical protein
MSIRNYSVVTANDVVRTYSRPGCEYAKRCSGYLKSQEWMPLMLFDANLPAFSAFANFVLYSGFIRKGTNISEDVPLLGKIKENITDKLGLRSEIIPRIGNRGSKLVLLPDDGVYAGRVLETMGIPAGCGPKSRMRYLGIPKYRKGLFELVSGDNPGNDSGDYDKAREIVRRLERDATAVLFSTRNTVDKRGKHDIWKINFFARPDEPGAEAFGRDNLKMIKFSLPGLEIEEDDIRARQLQCGSWCSYVNLNGKHLDCILDETNRRDMLKFNPELQKRYGIEAEFSPADISDLL